MLTINTWLKDRYWIESYVHKGGMGAVYQAKDRLKGETVAVKESFFDEAFLREQFVREATLLARLNHPALPKVYDYFLDGVGQFLVMEYIEGEDLERLLAREKRPLPLAQVLGWADKVLAALHYLHTHNPPVIHRDIKPANLKLKPDGEIMLLDFGLAKNATTPTLPGGSIRAATLVYAPPEQLKGAGTDGRSDLFSLGATLYHLLTNQPPPDARVRESVIQHGVPDPLRPLHQLNRAVPPLVTDCVQQALALERQHRYANAAEMRAALQEAVSLTIGPTVPVPPPVPSRIVSVPQPPPKPKLPTFTFETVTLDAQGREISRRSLQAEYVREDLGDGVYLDLVRISAGEFEMGSSADEIEQAFAERKRYSKGARREWYEWEGPRYHVRVPEFFMGRYAVTREQWRQVACWPKVQLDLQEDPSRFKDSWQQPVENVSWNDATEFCARLALRTGKRYRLPSEADWEYAARAGTTTPFAFGPTITPQIVNYNGKYPYGKAPWGEYRGTTTPGDSLGVANAFGLYDMHGNVWEWCEDEWHDSYESAPRDGSAWTTAPRIASAAPRTAPRDGGSRRVNRGGGWISGAVLCRSANRYHGAPGDRSDFVGFRLVRT